MVDIRVLEWDTFLRMNGMRVISKKENNMEKVRTKNKSKIQMPGTKKKTTPTLECGKTDWNMAQVKNF